MKALIFILTCSFLASETLSQQSEITIEEQSKESRSTVMLDSILSLDPFPKCDQFIEMVSKVANVSKVELNWNVYTACQLYMSACFEELGQLSNEINCLEEAYLYSTSKDGIDPFYTSVAINNLAQIEANKGNNNKAIKLYLEGIAFELEHPIDPLSIGLSYKNISARYRVLGDYENALLYAKSGLTNILSMPNSDFPSDKDKVLTRAMGFEMVGLSQQSLKDYKSALESFDNALKELRGANWSNDKTLYQKWVDINLRLIDLFLVQGDITRAKIMFDQFKMSDTKYSEYRAYMKAEYAGRLLMEDKKYAEAKSNLQRALELGEKQFEIASEFPVVPRLYMNLGDLYQEMDSFELAFLNYQKGLNWYDAQIGLNLERNPEVQIISGTPQAIEIIRKKAALAFNRFNETKQVEYLNIAIEAYKATIILIDKLKVDALDSGSKLFVAGNVKPIYDEALQVLSETYAMNQSDTLLNVIFEIMEKNKSAILFEVVQSRLQMLTSSIPAEEISKIENLRRNVAFYNEKKGKELLKKSPDKGLLNQFDTALFNNKQQLLLMEQHISELYPNYFDFRMNLFSALSIEGLQDRLSVDQVLIEYYEGSLDYYVFSISRDIVNFRKISKEKIIDYATVFGTLVTVPNKEFELSTVPKDLANLLIQPEIDLFKSPSHYIIVPDGILNYVSFEALKDRKDEFLISHAAFSYLNSVRQWKNVPSEYLASNSKMLAAAPNFDTDIIEKSSCMVSPLSQLLYSNDEVSFLEKNFEGKFVISESYTVKDFERDISSYDLLHLATHACVNLNDIMLSEIHFSDGFITIYDLQALEIKPKLQVLGACNSGMGTFSEGEGLISLSRGFIEAGVESIQSGMWKLDDYSTSKITKRMYLHLKDGHSKSNALRLAKLDFIEVSDKFRKHPFFWAGMVTIGNDSPLFEKSTSMVFFYLGIILLTFMIGIIWYWLNKRK